MEGEAGIGKTTIVRAALERASAAGLRLFAARPASGELELPYAGLGDLLATYLRLKAHGILPHWPINHGVTTSMYYRDPDNNRVELQIDNFPTAEELQDYFRSAAFAANPGVAT